MKINLSEQSLMDRIRKGEIQPAPAPNPVTTPEKKKDDKVQRDLPKDNVPLVNPVNRVGKLTYSFRAKTDYINPLLIQDLKKAVASAKIGDVQITYAETGHDKGSRHDGGWAVDISMINGKGYNYGKNTEFTVLGNIFVQELKKLGYKFGEIPEKEERAYLWQTMTGGNHYNHIHVSNTIGRSGEKKSEKKLPTELKIHKDVATFKNDLYDMLVLNPDKYFSEFRGWILGDDEEKAYQYYNAAINKRVKDLKINTLYNSKYISKWDKYNINNLNSVINRIGKFLREEHIGSSYTIPIIWNYPDLKTGEWRQRKITFKWNYL